MKKAQTPRLLHRTFRVRPADWRRFEAYCDRTGLKHAVLLRRFIQKLPTTRKPRDTIRVRVV
jgi:hypothetical protein